MDNETIKRLNGGQRMSKSQRDLVALGSENMILWDMVSVLANRLGGVVEITDDDMKKYRAPGMRSRIWEHKDRNGSVMLVPGEKAEVMPPGVIAVIAGQ